MWVRGLKRRALHRNDENSKSHPMWVRGLKPRREEGNKQFFVAPHVGAWIETTDVPCFRCYLKSHPMWVRGLKPW